MNNINMDIELKDILDNVKDKGINRKLDDLGRIVIPKEYRKITGCNSGIRVLIEFINDIVVIKKVDNNENNYSRKIDSLGRVVISKDFRESWDWNEDDLIRVSRYDEYVILGKVNKHCVFCYNEKNYLNIKINIYVINVNKNY